MVADAGGLDLGLTTGVLRAILAAPGTTGSRAEDLARRLAGAIRLGLILDGERLPSETRLASETGVAVVTLREVLKMLREEGLITTRRGRGGGTVVTAPTDMDQELARRLRELTLLDIRDLGDQRASVLCTSADLAARRSLDADIARLRAHLDRLRTARDAGEMRRADSQFTVEVAVAAQSPRLAKEDLRVRAEVGDLLWLELTRQERQSAVSVRTKLVDAIARRDAAAARELATDVVARDTARLARRRMAAYLDDRGQPGKGDVLPELHRVLEAVFESLAVLAREFAQMVLDCESTETPLRRRELRMIRPDIESLLEDHGELVVGAGVVVEPGLLDDVPRWLEWMWRHASGSPEVLRVNLDPLAPDFYDYTTTEWFREARATLQRQVAGPYVDHACTGEYSLTVSAPVTVHDRFIGVVAADIPMSAIERIVVAHLGRNGASTLHTPDGRILASMDPVRLTGELMQRGNGSSGRTLLVTDLAGETG